MNKKINIYIAGDSTAETYPENRYPRAGWGQMLSKYFNDNVIIKNYSLGGRSSKSFIKEGHLENIEKVIKEGDYLFIQFAHNDEKTDERHTQPNTTYKQYLKKYVKLAMENNAVPILFTPPVRRKFDKNGNLIDTHGDYPNAVIELSKELNVNYVDLFQKTKKLYMEIGEKESLKMHMIFDNNAYSNYPEGVYDNTHFCEYGANVLAQFIVDSIKEKNIELDKYLL